VSPALTHLSSLPQDPTALTLPCALHREVAIMLVVAHSTHLPNEPGGHEFDIAMAEATGKKVRYSTSL